jgi:hypothetical protein
MRLIRINGYRMKDGKLVPTMKHLDVSARLRQRASKRVRVARPIERVDRRRMQSRPIPTKEQRAALRAKYGALR